MDPLGDFFERETVDESHVQETEIFFVQGVHHVVQFILKRIFRIPRVGEGQQRFGSGGNPAVGGQLSARQYEEPLNKAVAGLKFQPQSMHA